jgi:dGTP triphosphohydrolase
MSVPETPSPDGPVLNENQRRHFEVVLSMLEDAVARVEALCNPELATNGVLTVVEDDLPHGAARRAQPLIESIRAQIARLASDLQLAPRRVSRRRVVQALLTSEVIRIDDSTPSQLRGYGVVDARFDAVVAPRLGEIRDTLMNLARTLRSDDAPPHTTRP